MDTAILEEAGLTEKEAKLYLLLLEEGASTTGPLIKKLGLHKATVYALLERLIERGLVGSIVTGRVREFQAAEPRMLLDLLQERAEKLQGALPELEHLRSRAKSAQRVTVYEGKRATHAALTAFFNSLTPADTHRAFVIPKQDAETQAFFKRLSLARGKRGVRCQYIFSDDDNEEAEERARSPHTEVKLVPPSLASPAVFNVFGDRSLINLMAAKQPIAIEVQSPELADALKKHFDALWGQPARVYRGEQEVKDLFYANLDRCAPGEEYLVLGATYGELIASLQEWFVAYHRERKRRGINVRLLADAETAESIRKRDLLVGPGPAKAEVRTLSPELKNPVQVNIFRDACAIISFSKEPFAIVIENKDIAESYRRYFELLWKQEVEILRGYAATWENLKEVAQAKNVRILGARGYHFDKHPEHLREFQHLVKQSGTHIRNLVDQAARGHPLLATEGMETRYLPNEFRNPNVVFMFNDMVTISQWTEKEPILLRIRNKNVYESYVHQFDLLWNQETLVLRGPGAVWDFLQEYTRAKDVRLIGARGYYFDRHPEHLPLMRALIEQHKTRIRNLVDAGAKGNPWLAMPGMEVRYLPPEFESSSAISLYDGKVVLTQWAEKEPIVIHINNKHVYDSYVKQFEVLWNQETLVLRGFDAVWQGFEEYLRAKDVRLIGARGYYFDQRPQDLPRYQALLDRFGARVRNIVDEGSRGHPLLQLRGIETRYLPNEFRSPSVIWLFDGKVRIAQWTEREPIVLHINNRNVYDSYVKQFEALWKAAKP